MDCLLNAVELSQHLPEYPRGMKRRMEPHDRESKRSTPSSPHPSMSISSLLSSSMPCDLHDSPPLSPTTSPRRSCASSDHPLTPVNLTRAVFDDGTPKTAYRIRDLMAAAPQTHATIRCFHAAVAQKSYGTEKRFMCPPPIVRSVGCSSSLGVSLAVECDQGPGLEQRGQLESNCATFRYLHVGGTNKAKACHLRLGISGESKSALSAPIAIISKPSKKSIKTRSPHSCIASGSTVALYTRINSQTVRTNYLATVEGALSVAKAQWTPFTINLVDGIQGSTVNYGSIISLTDLDSGLVSEPLEVCRVERGLVVEATGPISQLQKVALRRPNTSSFLSSTASTQVSSSEGLPVRLAFTEAQNIDDREVWTLVGIAMFETTLHPPAPLDQIRSLQILPALATSPTLDPTSARLTLRLRQGYPVPQIWLGWLGPLPTHQTASTLTVSLPDPIVAIQQMSWCSPPTPCNPHVFSYRFPLIAVDSHGFLFNLGPAIEIQVSRPNPNYTQALYTWLI